MPEPTDICVFMPCLFLEPCHNEKTLKAVWPLFQKAGRRRDFFDFDFDNDFDLDLD
jgi:hypothetical protein